MGMVSQPAGIAAVAHGHGGMARMMDGKEGVVGLGGVKEGGWAEVGKVGGVGGVGRRVQDGREAAAVHVGAEVLHA